MKKVKVTINVDPKMKKQIKAYVASHDYKSESEFCAEAVEFYFGYLHHKHDKSYIDRVMVQTVDATVEKHADRISDSIFKLAVSLEKEDLRRTGYYEYDDDLEEEAIDNVKKRQCRL